MPLWVVDRRGRSREREQALATPGVEVLRVPRPRRPARSWRGAEAAGRARDHPAHGRGRADPVAAAFVAGGSGGRGAVCSARPTTIGADGIDALDGLPLAALTQLAAAASSSAARRSAADTVETVRAGAEMFTGIVTDIGEVVAVEPRAEGLARLKIACALRSRHRSPSAPRSPAAACASPRSRAAGTATAPGSRSMPPPRRCA